MIIKCGRCGKEIDTPDKHNAKYIRNPKDERTFGKSLVNKFHLLDDKEGIKESFNTFKDAKQRLNYQMALLDTEILDLEKTKKGYNFIIKTIESDLEKLESSILENKEKLKAIEQQTSLENKELKVTEQQTSLKNKEELKTTKQQALVLKKKELETVEQSIKDKNARKNQIRIVEGVTEENIPKTLIVCPKCVIDGDEIIW